MFTALRGLLLALPLGLLLVSPTVYADQHRDQSSKKSSAKPRAARYGERNTVPLDEVIRAVGKNTGRVFTVQSGVPADITVGTVSIKSMDYSELLLVLEANGLGATAIGDITAIAYLANIRSAPGRFLGPGESALSGEHVTRVFVLENTSAAQLVPVLRPLLPNYAHLAAMHEKNALIVTDTFANSERIKAIVERLDAIDSAK